MILQVLKQGNIQIICNKISKQMSFLMFIIYGLSSGLSITLATKSAYYALFSAFAFIFSEGTDRRFIWGTATVGASTVTLYLYYLSLRLAYSSIQACVKN